MSILNVGLMKCGRTKWQEAEATRKDFNIELTRQDKKFFLSALQGHSGRNPIDPTLQDTVLIPNDVRLSKVSCDRQNTLPSTVALKHPSRPEPPPSQGSP